MARGKLVVISGPSGVGKGTVIDLLIKANPNLVKRAVTATTRPPRPGEVDGKSHYFLSKTEFRKKIANGEFIEHNQFDLHYYGTLRESVRKAMEAAEDVILEVDVGAATAIKKEFPRAILIFVTADTEELEARLRKRHTEQAHDLELRLSKAHHEIKTGKAKFDHVVVNPEGHPEQAVAEIEKILAL